MIDDGCRESRGSLASQVLVNLLVEKGVELSGSILFLNWTKNSLFMESFYGK